MAEVDWVFPPLSATPESLWPALHDAVLETFSEDRLAREVRLTFELGFPDPAGTAPNRVIVVLRHVTHVLLLIARSWPGPAPKMNVAATPEMQAAYAAYQKKGRTETVGIETLAACLQDGAHPDVINPALHRSNPGLTLVIDGYSPDDRLGDWWDLKIGAESLDVLHADGSPLGLDTLMGLGRSGWDLWAAEGEARRSATVPAPTGDEGQPGGKQEP